MAGVTAVQAASISLLARVTGKLNRLGGIGEKINT
jgi:hypothetical protein